MEGERERGEKGERGTEKVIGVKLSREKVLPFP
jgi:hypothetical protein